MRGNAIVFVPFLRKKFLQRIRSYLEKERKNRRLIRGRIDRLFVSRKLRHRGGERCRLCRQIGKISAEGFLSQWLPLGGGWRRSRVGESAKEKPIGCDEASGQYKVPQAPSVTLRMPPSSRRKAYGSRPFTGDIYCIPKTTRSSRGSKEAIAGEKIKNKGIRSNEICACRDRRPRRSESNG